jgi:hypothetical protein
MLQRWRGHRWQCKQGVYDLHVIKATNTLEYVILTAFPRQEWLRERASMLRYTYITCLFYILSLLLMIQ